MVVTNNVWGNGWTADFQTAGADATGNQYIYDYWYGNGWVATDGYCGGGSLTITCEYD